MDLPRRSLLFVCLIYAVVASLLGGFALESQVDVPFPSLPSSSSSFTSREPPVVSWSRVLRHSRVSPFSVSSTRPPLGLLSLSGPCSLKELALALVLRYAYCGFVLPIYDNYTFLCNYRLLMCWPSCIHFFSFACTKLFCRCIYFLRVWRRSAAFDCLCLDLVPDSNGGLHRRR